MDRDGGLSDGDGNLETMFGKSPLGLSKSKDQSRPESLNAAHTSNATKVKDNVRKKLIVEDSCPTEQPCRSMERVPASSTADEGILGEDDLYGDLYMSSPAEGGCNDQSNLGAGILRLKVSKLTSDVAAKDAIIVEAEKVIEDLRETVARLESENATLKYNISSLFNTAKLEIERKEREIEENRSHIKQLTQKAGKLRT